MSKKIEQLSRELQQIAAVVEQLGVKGMNGIEQDVVLERLRAVYQVVKFGLDEQEDCCVGTPSSAECGVAIDPPQADCQSKCDAEASEHKVVESPSVEEQKQDTPPTEPIEPIEPKAPTPPLAESEEPVRRRVDRETLLSLYNNGDPASEAEQKPASKADATSNLSVEVDIPKDIFDDMERAAHRAVADVEPKQTVGDVYVRNHTADMGDKISKETTTALRKSIGINDRFLIIKEIFEGDDDIYDGVIDELESFANLDEALLHIHENYRWNPNSEGVKMLIELLTKKLS